MTATLEAAARPAYSRRRINAVFGTVLLGMLVAALDQTIVGTALPTIVGTLGGAQHLSWVVTSYLLASTITTVVIGKFGDLFGRKLMFQLSMAIFGVGSFFCGFADDMLWLIIWRAVQGIGGGGLMVTATALIADVIPMRERGKYQGLLGSVFGVVTVAGPMLGGFFVDHLSWRWVFYVNIPLVVVAFLVGSATIPTVRSAAKPVIDYLGILFIGLGASGLILVTTWGGTTYAWDSPEIIWTAVGSVLALVLFVLVERRAPEPMLPLRLFANPVFSVAGILAFIVGFAMLGALSYLPTYMQYVRGVSATDSGVRMLPMVFGLLIASTFAGNMVSKTGRYKIFPILGSIGITIGLYLLSTLDAHTSILRSSLFMLVLGVGIGLGMQVLTIVVQNNVDFADLGVATSGVTFLRSIGSSFGAAIFGTIYAGQLSGHLEQIPVPAGVDPRALQVPQLLHKLPEQVAAPFIQAYVDSLHTVFLYAAPVGVLALLVAFFLKEVPLRDTSRAGAVDPGEGFGMPEARDRDQELEHSIALLMFRERRDLGPTLLRRLDSTLDEGALWCLVRVAVRNRRGLPFTVADAAGHVGVPAAVLRPAFDKVIAGGHLAADGDRLLLTDTGQQEFQRIAACWKGWLAEKLADWGPQRELAVAIDRVVERMADQEYESGRHALV
ncbi:DHA2 family efflux MFS transporter permease subunit [Pseudonocardiaceae bacterium YIM PH 21723]|nr:DHA2 family efflux MFS transporter permease subunit [Pseudonocardiaceae bacterium YIM PH 21723]